MSIHEREMFYTPTNGQKYQLMYHRSPWWNGEKHTLKNWLNKIIWWHYSIWVVLKNGGRVESDHGMVRGLFPLMRRFARNMETKRQIKCSA